MPTRTARASWTGTIRSGSGTFQGESGVIQGNYSFDSRFGTQATQDNTLTNPEEMLAAAQAACFTMALSGNLERGGFPPTRIDTEADCSIIQDGDGFKIDKIHVRTFAEVDNVSQEAFTQIANETLKTCPVSKAFEGNLELTLEATLAGAGQSEVLLATRRGGGSFTNIRV